MKMTVSLFQIEDERYIKLIAIVRGEPSVSFPHNVVTL